jgi:actin-like ATPase involved in cell morphogenesis
MSGRPNFYELLKLDPAIDDWPTIEGQLKDMQRKWAKDRTMGNPKDRRHAEASLARMKEIETVLSNPDTRREEARKRVRQIQQAEEQKRKEFDEVVDLLKVGRPVTGDQIRKLVQIFAGTFSEDAIRKHLKNAKIPFAGDPAAGRKPRAVKDQIDTITGSNIRMNLSHLGLKTLYEFLQMGHRSSPRALADKAEEIYKENHRLGKTDADAYAKNALAGFCITVFQNDQEKARYDNFLVVEAMDGLAGNLELAGADNFLTRDQLDTLVKQARERGVPADDALAYIENHAAKRKWNIEKSLDVASPSETRCSKCGEALDPEFPECSTKEPSDSTACSVRGPYTGDAPSNLELDGAEIHKEVGRGYASPPRHRFGKTDGNRDFGIDLGTTNSCIAYVDEQGELVVIPNSEGESTTPSVIYFENAENVVVGQAAKEVVALYPDRCVSTIKRAMGDPFWEMVILGQTYKPQDISSFVLRKVVQDAASFTGQDIKDVVITCPIHFGVNEKEATRQAGVLAGLNVLDVISETTAAVLAYGVEQTEDQAILVYDLGGATFDITMIHVTDREMSVICTGGDQQLGGKNWDDAIVNYLAQEFANVTGTSAESLLDDQETYQELLTAAERCKKTLSTGQTVKQAVRFGGERVKVELTRATFDKITQSMLEHTFSMTDQVIENAERKGFPKIDKLLLVGGSTYMPQVIETITKRYPFDVRQFDPNLAVAKGAAIYGFMQRHPSACPRQADSLRDPLEERAALVARVQCEVATGFGLPLIMSAPPSESSEIHLVGTMDSLASSSVEQEARRDS